MAVPIGKIVKSNSHIDYVCQVYGAGDLPRQPRPADWAFGEFVAVELASAGEEDGHLVGVIYNTLLLNPEFGNMGPRLAPHGEGEVFTPDLLNERAILVGILALGWRDGDGAFHQGVPATVAEVDGGVRGLDGDEVRAFHRGADGRVALRYAALLQGLNNPLVPQLLLKIIDRLTALFPDQGRRLQVMRDNVAWKSIVQPAS